MPGEVLDVYRLWRPTPLLRATRLERALDTPARIYFKYEGVSPAGSHKPNTAVAQAFYNKQAGVGASPRRPAPGSGVVALDGVQLLRPRVPGVHGEGLVRAEAVPPDLHGDVRRRGPAVADLDHRGREEDPGGDPDSTGSLGIAISEAIEVAATNEDTNYSIGSCLNHVLLHQSVVGLEAKEQMELAGEVPDVVVGCVGGGSNYGGLAYPFMAGRLRGDTPDMRFLATEPAACPTLTKGRFAYDFGDTAELTPLLPMYTLGHDFVPAPVHAGGLRYHGDSPSLSLLVSTGTWRRPPTRRTRCSRRPCCSRRPRGSSRRPSRPTRSAAR